MKSLVRYAAIGAMCAALAPAFASSGGISTAGGAGYPAKTQQGSIGTVREVLRVRQFGAVGTADDTAVVQAALNAAPGKTLYFGAGTYTVNPITVASNTRIVFDPSVILKAKTGYGRNSALLTIAANDVVIEGNHAKIQMLKREYSSGEQRHGVMILTANGVTIKDLHVTDTGGDGFYVGSVDNVRPSSNITLNNCYSDNARRNGLSIVAVKNMWVNGGEYANTVGTAPEYGIDIEPNSSADAMENINIVGVSTRGNAKGGVQIAIGLAGATSSNSVRVNVSGWHSYRDGQTGALRIVNGPVKRLYGSINVTNSNIENPAGRGVDFARLNANMPKVSLRGVTVTNPAFSMAGPGDVDRSAVSLETSHNGESGVTSNISFEDCLFIDTRAKPTMFSGVYLGGKYALDNIAFRNVQIKNATIRDYTFVGARNTNISVKNDAPKTVVVPSSLTNIDRYAGSIISVSADSDLTIAPAATFTGLELEFKNTSASHRMVIVPTAGDTIVLDGLASNAGLELRPGVGIKLKAVANGWEVVGKVSR